MPCLDKKSVTDVEVAGKKVLVRVDFNVPLKADKIKDDTRILAAVPTIRYLLKHNTSLILISHLGRPKGQRRPDLSLAPVAKRLAEILDIPVVFVDDCIGEKVNQAVSSLKSGEVLLLENLRFHPEEEKNDPEFAKKLADLADIYVNDAFGVAHRAHASTEGITHFLPSVAGFLIEKEMKALCSVIDSPRRPYVAIIGGAKVSNKIMIIESLIKKVDKLLIGGGMGNTFLAAAGYNMQTSLIEPDKIDWAREFLQTDIAKERLVLPVDLVVAAFFSADAEHRVCPVDGVPDGWQALDIGPATVDLFTTVVNSAGTIVWNGPLGAFEIKAYAEGTMAIARAVADATAFSIIGGGDSVSAVHKAGVMDRISHISTGGGASLELLGGEILPGIAALPSK